MYKGYILHCKALFHALKRIEFPTLSPIREEMHYFNFENGMGLEPLFQHILDLYEEMISIIDNVKLEMTIHEFALLFPEEDYNEVERIFHIIAQWTSTIDFHKFKMCMLCVPNDVLKAIMQSWEKKIKFKNKNFIHIEQKDKECIMMEYNIEEKEYEWLERTFNVLDNTNQGRILKEDAILLFDNGVIDIGKEIHMYFNYIQKSYITLKEFLCYIYGPMKIESDVWKQKDEEREKCIISQMTPLHNEAEEEKSDKTNKTEVLYTMDISSISSEDMHKAKQTWYKKCFLCIQTLFRS